ncbi:MAG: PQQ-dependent sugar dehydrogenase [Desulfuromonadales bacterium]|nr:PQQ-dependent sugar dehydrogenase [Desulfuromonadales bacterium]
MPRTLSAHWYGFALFLLLLGTACNGGSSSSPAIAAEISLERAFAELSFRQPVAMVQAPGNGSRWWVLEKGGRVLTFTAGEAEAAVALDLGERVDAGPGEAGLLGIAFHPRFVENSQLFLSYTAPGSPLVSRITRFTTPDGGRTIDPATEQILLTLEQPFGNHNGGQIAFGPDGYLYIGFGDGGSGGDPQGNGQNVQTLLGAILRLDVDTSGGERAYGIPGDNPFAAGGGRPELYAWGQRNPWRFSFDRQTGRLWAADVGQNHWEEVNLIDRGGNYGWNIREGSHCYPPSVQTCRTEGLIDPVAEYPNAGGDCSITGGYVYRGQKLPSLQGRYLFGDFCSGRLWALPLNADGVPAGGHRLLLDSDHQISSFAEGNDGELYLLDFGGGGVWQVVGGE